MKDQTSIVLCRDGVPWAPDQCVQLPRYFTVGVFRRLTPWGGRPNHALWPAGPWLSGDRLRGGYFRTEYQVTGLRFPAQSLTVIDANGRREIDVTTGFVVGALLGMGPLECVYVVLYDEDGRMTPRIIEPTKTWLKRNA